MACQQLIPKVVVQVSPGAYAVGPPRETFDEAIAACRSSEFSVEVYGARKKNGRRPLYRFNENTTLKEMWDTLIDHRR
jgi:hypothetical protein